MKSVIDGFLARADQYVLDHLRREAARHSFKQMLLYPTTIPSLHLKSIHIHKVLLEFAHQILLYFYHHLYCI